MSKIALRRLTLSRLKSFEDFGEVEEFAVFFGRPAEEAEVVGDGFGDVAFVDVVRDRGAAVAFAQLLTGLVEDEGNVGELGRSGSESLVEFDVFGSVGEVVLAADDVGHAHFDIVDDVDEVEDPGAIGAANGHVRVGAGIGHVEIDLTADEVGDGDGLARGAEAKGSLVFVEAARVAEDGEVFFVDFVALTLEVGTVVAADLRAFVPLESEPAEAVVDDLVGFVGVALGVGVLHAEHEGAAVFAGVEPVEEGGAGASDVEKTGGRRGEAGADSHGDLDRINRIYGIDKDGWGWDSANFRRLAGVWCRGSRWWGDGVLSADPELLLFLFAGVAWTGESRDGRIRRREIWLEAFGTARLRRWVHPPGILLLSSDGAAVCRRLAGLRRGPLGG